MSTPIVSVIIPAFNAASFVGRAVQSVLSQTHGALDLIVVTMDQPMAPRRPFGALGASCVGLRRAVAAPPPPGTSDWRTRMASV
jgi:cellulose synthase/poly-beta-1,6-N-acetylglucosamine synthase-like glycosyltransferase